MPTSSRSPNAAAPACDPQLIEIAIRADPTVRSVHSQRGIEAARDAFATVMRERALDAFRRAARRVFQIQPN